MVSLVCIGIFKRIVEYLVHVGSFQIDHMLNLVQLIRLCENRTASIAKCE